MKNKMLYLTLSTLCVSLLFSPNVFSQTTVVRLEPSSVRYPQHGGQPLTVDVDIVIENGRNVSGYQVMLGFEYPNIEYVEIQQGDYLPASAFLGGPDFIGSRGTLFFAATAAPHERNGSGILATLTFKINTIKPSTFHLIAGDPSQPTLGTILSDKDVRLSFPRTENAGIFGGIETFDLVIESVRAKPTTVAPGEKFKLYATLKNRGPEQSAATTLRYLWYGFSTNPRVSPTQIGIGGVEPLPKDGTVLKYHEVTAPTQPGNYYYGVCVDAVNNEGDTGNNCGVITIPVTVTPGGAELEVPPGLISQVAFSSHFTYFMFVAQFPEIRGVADTNTIYRECTITLDIPGVSDKPVLESDENNRRLDNPSYLMYQITTARQQLKEAGVTGPLVETTAKVAATTGIAAGIGAVFGPGGIVAGGVIGFSVGVVSGFVEVLWESGDEKERILRATADPFFVLNPSDYYNAQQASGRPIAGIPYIFIIPRPIRNIKVHIKQEYSLRSERPRAPLLLRPIHTATFEGVWYLADSALAAPSARLMSIADYRPFASLSLEGQARLLGHLEALRNTGESQLPAQTSLLSNYPNPFNPETWIPYQLAESADVALTIYDIQGRVVRHLDFGHQRAGIYQSKARAAYWDGRNAQGEPVASGVYFYTLKAGDFTATRKMLIRK